jgi:hypothetical protein
MAGFGDKPAKPDIVKSKAGDSYAADSTQGKVIIQSQKEKEDKKPSMLSSLKTAIGEKFTSIDNQSSVDDTAEEKTSASTIAPMQGMMDIFIAIRDGINTLVFLAGGSTTEKSAAADKAGAAESAAADKADAADKITARKENLADSEGKKDEPKKQGMLGSLKDSFTSEAIGPESTMMSKLIKVGLLGAMALLLKFSDEFQSAIAFVLEKGKKVFDMLGPNGEMILGLTALAAFIMPKTLMLLVTGVGKGTIKFALTLMKGAFFLMQAFMSGEFIKKLAGTYVGQGILRALAVMKSTFAAMQVFLFTTVPNKIAGSYIGQGILKAFTAMKAAFAAMQVFLFTTVPNKIAGSYIGQGILKAFTILKAAFASMQVFLFTTLPGKIASSYVGIGITKAITALKAAFVAMQVFLASTMVPAITTMMAPFVVPLALLVAAVLVAVAVFTSIKAGIDEFKQSLSEGDSMLESIIDGVATALLTLVTLPITLIKNFAAWALEKLGFEGIAAKLKEFSFVDAIKNGITTLITKIKSFVLGLFDVDFMAFFAKIGNIGMLFLGYIKAIAAGAKAGLLALFPGGDSPTQAYDKAFKKSMANTNAVMEEKRVATVKLAELTRLDNVKKENERNEKKMNFYTTTTTNKGGDTISTNAVTLANLSANHTEPTQMQLNMANR